MKPFLLLALIVILTTGFSACNDSNPSISGGNDAVTPITSTVEPDAVQAVLATEQPTVLFFKSKFCKDCKAMTPIMQTVATEFPSVDVRYIYMSSENTTDQALIDLYNPVVVPTIVTLKADGTEATTIIGRASQADLTDSFKQLTL